MRVCGYHGYMRQKTGNRDYFGMEQEDYLEAIYELEIKSGSARISDLALVLSVKKPSATQMAERLKKQGYILYEPYKGIRLTPEGRKIAMSLEEYRNVLIDFFTVLKIPKNVQQHDIHGMEHYLSPITLKKIRELTTFLKKK
jgi:Mn-dependent DtxR family transcriptional regulator